MEPYDVNLSEFMLDMSNAAYCDYGAVLDWSCSSCVFHGNYTIIKDEYGLPEVSVFDGVVGGFGKVQDYGTQAFVAAMPAGTIAGMDKTGIVVSFRGSDKIINAIEDIEFAKLVPDGYVYSQCPDCKVHSGFYEAWLSVAQKVCDAVHNLKKAHPEADIYVTGHSLGAAMAVLAAVHLNYWESLPVQYLYTYGQPRVGNSAFVDYFHNGTRDNCNANTTVYRIVHWKDPIARGPPQGLGLEGYMHTSVEVFYDENSSAHKACDFSGEDPTCSDTYNLLQCATSFQDHLTYLGRTSGSCS